MTADVYIVVAHAVQGLSVEWGLRVGGQEGRAYEDTRVMKRRTSRTRYYAYGRVFDVVSGVEYGFSRV